MKKFIRNVVHYETGLLTNPASGTVLYEAGVSGHASGSALLNILLTASAPITVTYTTIYGETVTGQVMNLSADLNLVNIGIVKIELAASLTGTMEMYGEELIG